MEDYSQCHSVSISKVEKWPISNIPQQTMVPKLVTINGVTTGIWLFLVTLTLNF